MTDNPQFVGRTIDGRYVVEREIRRGGMGVVCEAVHVGTGRRVAIKLLFNLEGDGRAEMAARLEREARLVGSLQTPHVVQVLDAGMDEVSGSPYLAMELLKGSDLRETARRVGPIPSDLALRVVAQACMGLAQAHASGVIHRDIKPGNIFLSEGDDGEVVVKVIDFGIAKLKQDKLGQAAGDLTRTGTLLGSPHYMSPEQAQGLKDIDARTDVWSMGVVLFKLLSGRTPCQDQDTMGQILVSVCTENPPPLRSIAPWVPTDVASLVARILRRERGDRFSNAGEMLEDILKLLPAGAAITKAQIESLADQPPLAALPQVIRTSVAPVPTAAPLLSRGRLAILAAGAAVAIGTSAFLSWRLVATRAPAPAQAASSPSPTASLSSAETRPAQSSAAPAGELAQRLRVSPEDALVEVDGRSAAVVEGSVEVRGAPGSTHRVRVRAAGRETIREVAITQVGPLPSQVALDSPAPGTAASGARVAGAPGPTRAAGTPRPASSGIAPKPVSTQLGVATSLE